MTSARKTIDGASLQRLLEAGAVIDVEVVGDAGGWRVSVGYECARRTLAGMRGDERLFRRFETLVRYLQQRGIAAFRVDARAWQPLPADSQKDERSRQASERMKRAHAAASLARRGQGMGSGEAANGETAAVTTN